MHNNNYLNPKQIDKYIIYTDEISAVSKQAVSKQAVSKQFQSINIATIVCQVRVGQN